MKICYAVVKRGDRTYWNRIGVAFPNRDGSLNVKLDAVPVTGELQIRDYVPQVSERVTRGSSDDDRREANRTPDEFDELEPYDAIGDER